MIHTRTEPPTMSPLIVALGCLAVAADPSAPAPVVPPAPASPLPTLPAPPQPPATGSPPPVLKHALPGLPTLDPPLLALPAAPAPPFDPLQYQAACPGPHAQPFQRVPRIERVGPCRNDALPGTRPARLWVKEFDQPAHVPVPRFCPDGSPAPADGLLIYEGMRLTVDPDSGTYDVSFTASTPDMPVTLRLQLQFGPTPQTALYTLTLPPIRLDPTDRRNRSPDGAVFHVHHRGFSPLFREGMALSNRDALDVAGNHPARQVLGPGEGRLPPTMFVWRVGSARFGSGPPPEDELRR